MKRKVLIGLFSFGTVFGFGSGVASMACMHGRHHEARRAQFEQHVADVGVDAALRANDDYEEAPPPPPRRHRRHHRHGR